MIWVLCEDVIITLILLMIPQAQNKSTALRGTVLTSGLWILNLQLIPPNIHTCKITEKLKSAITMWFPYSKSYIT